MTCIQYRIHTLGSPQLMCTFPIDTQVIQNYKPTITITSSFALTWSPFNCHHVTVYQHSSRSYVPQTPSEQRSNFACNIVNCVACM